MRTRAGMILSVRPLKETENNHTQFPSGNGKDSAPRFTNDGLFDDDNCCDLH
jgi:hypothetical protein